MTRRFSERDSIRGQVAAAGVFPSPPLFVRLPRWLRWVACPFRFPGRSDSLAAMPREVAPATISARELARLAAAGADVGLVVSGRMYEGRAMRRQLRLMREAAASRLRGRPNLGRPVTRRKPGTPRARRSRRATRAGPARPDD